MSLYENIEDIKKDLAAHMNIRTDKNTKYKIEIVVGETGFIAGSRDVVKKIIRDLHELDRDDVLIIQIDDVDYKDEHTVVLVHDENDKVTVYKNINTENTNTIFQNII